MRNKEDELIRRGDVLNFLYKIKCDRSWPKNYGTLLTIINAVWNLPSAYSNEEHSAEEKANSVLNEAKSLKSLIAENPTFPIAVLVDEDICTGDYTSVFAPNITCEVGEILDCDQDIDECCIYHNRDDFKEDLRDALADYYFELSDEDFEKKLTEKLKEYEPHWKECILVRATT